MKGKSIAVLSLMALLTVALSAGCGSSGSTASEASQHSEPVIAEKDSGLTVEDSGVSPKDLFLAQAEEICEDGMIEKDKAVASGLKKLGPGKPPLPDLLQMVDSDILPIYREMIEQIDQLDAPEADRAQIENIVTEYEVALGVAERSPGKALRQYLFGEAVKAAKAFGLRQCTF